MGTQMIIAPTTGIIEQIAVNKPKNTKSFTPKIKYPIKPVNPCNIATMGTPIALLTIKFLLSVIILFTLLFLKGTFFRNQVSISNVSTNIKYKTKNAIKTFPKVDIVPPTIFLA